MKEQMTADIRALLPGASVAWGSGEVLYLTVTLPEHTALSFELMEQLSLVCHTKLINVVGASEFVGWDEGVEQRVALDIRWAP